LLYRPKRGLGQGPIVFAFCCFGTVAAALAVLAGETQFFRDLVGWGSGAVYTAYEWLWRSCQWVRVDAGALEWKTPLTHGQVPLHEVRKISIDRSRSASIEIRGHRSLSVAVQAGFDDLTAAIVAGAPHVVITGPPAPAPRRGTSPRRGTRPSAAAYHVRPAFPNPRQFLTESAKVTDPCDPPVPVWVVDARLDERPWPGLLYGWANNPLGDGAGPRGLVVAAQPDGRAVIGWAMPEHVSRRT
jgi:hypothetical protein